MILAAFLAAPSTAAFAQDDVVVEGADEAVEDDGFDEQEGEVIIMTGSSIERRETKTAVPLEIVDRADLDAAGVPSVGQILQNLPSQSNAINVQFNNGGDGATRINLRGLGSGRTLVLVNGRRHVAGGTGADGSVDLNAIPIAVIERVEVLKDGASAIYGSDAIGGVVNIITRDDWQGTEATGYYGSTSDGLASVYDVSATAGVVSKKGNVVFSAGYYQQNPMMAGDREFSSTDKQYDWQASKDDPDGNPDGNDVWYPSGSSATPEGMLIDRLGLPGNDLWQSTVCPDNICQIGSYREFQFPGEAGLGDLYNYQPENYLVTPQQRYNVFSSGNYKLTDRTSAFFEASYLNRKSDQRLAPEPLFTISEGLTVAGDNYYNPFGRPFIDIRRRLVESGPRRFLQDVDTMRLVTGFKGNLAKDLPMLKNWRWTAAFNYGRTSATSINEGRLVLSRVARALGPSYFDTDEGRPLCGTPGNVEDFECVPLNLFGGAGTITQDMVNYMSYTGIADGFNEMRSWTFSTSGKLADTPWGGDISMGTGVEYRAESGAFIPDPMTASGDTTGNKGDPTEGGFDVYEAYAEVSFVPVIGKPMAEWLELNGAARTSRYNTFGQHTTWKGSGLWRVKKGVSFRGTYSTAFRAPSINALFSGQNDSFPGVTDPCDTSQGDRSPNEQANCSSDGLADDYEDQRTQLRSLVGGNPDLDPETAKILTMGALYEPDFVPGLSLTLDYFKVDVDNAISSKGSSLILSNCYAAPSDSRQDCDLITRDPNTGLITNIVDTATNIGGNVTSGLDFAVRYDHSTKVGRFRHSAEGTWLGKYDSLFPGINEMTGEPIDRTVQGKGVYDLGVFPEWKANFSSMWARNNWGAGANVRYIGSIRECEDDDCRVGEEFTEEDPAPLTREVDANITADAFVNWSKKTEMGTTRLSVGMNNMFNQKPAIIFNGFLATSDASTYDFLGRYMYVRLVQQF